MFGAGAFSELGFSETKDTEAVFVESLPVIYFNSSTLAFPLKINKNIDLPLDINKLQNHSLIVNKNADFPLSINKLQNYGLIVNKIINFTTRR